MVNVLYHSKELGEFHKSKELGMNIYVGNLSREVTEEDLRQAFEAFGQVASATVIKDKITGEPRGFGFVEMTEKDKAEEAVAKLNGTELKGKTINVNEARPRNNDRRGGGNRSGGGGRFGSNNRGRDNRW